MKPGRNARSGHRGLALLTLLAAALLGSAGLLAAGGRGAERAKTPILEAGRVDLARTAYLADDPAKAERLLRDYLKDRPEDRDARRLLGRVLAERGRLLEARELFEGLLKEESKDADALRGLGRVLRGLGQHETAVRRLQAAVDLRKDDPALWKEFGLAQRESGDSLGALFSIQKSLSLDRDQVDLTALLSELAMGKLSDQNAVPGRPRLPAFDRMNPRPLDPATLVPGPKVPDPTRHLPTPNRAGPQR